jgi:hypothetical protein
MFVKELRIGKLRAFVKNSLKFEIALQSAGKGHTSSIRHKGH